LLLALQCVQIVLHKSSLLLGIYSFNIYRRWPTTFCSPRYVALVPLVVPPLFASCLMSLLSHQAGINRGIRGRSKQAQNRLIGGSWQKYGKLRRCASVDGRIGQ
jgi:hypothetical protein